ncbi:hypothetical protein [Yoonia sp. 2307UL14-13]|uniref:hypothetical protein n=1 Tax=Yoonia sp. 2307UL14-13 TaxID=3126506 RepID=UPI0030B2D1F5
MPLILCYLARLCAKIQSGFQPHNFTLWCIHATEIYHTAAHHPEQWTHLHMTVGYALLATAVDWLKA